MCFSGHPLRAGLYATPLRYGPAGSLPLVGLAPIPGAFPRPFRCPARHRPALRPASLHSLRRRCATLVLSLRTCAQSLPALATAPVASFGQPALPQPHRTRPAHLRAAAFAPLRRLRSVRPAPPAAPILPRQATAARRPPPRHPTRRTGQRRPCFSRNPAPTPAHRTRPGALRSGRPDCAPYLCLPATRRSVRPASPAPGCLLLPLLRAVPRPSRRFRWSLWPGLPQRRRQAEGLRPFDPVASSSARSTLRAEPLPLVGLNPALTATPVTAAPAATPAAHTPAHTPAHRTAGHGAGSPLLPAHQPPRRRGPRRAVPPAPPDTAAAPLTPARRTAAAQPGRPSHHRSTPGSASAPLPSVQAAGQKSPPPAKSFCVPATQAEARPASRRVLLGEPPNPRHHALADARSSASGSAAGKWLLHPHKARFAEVCWGPRGRPPNPLAEAFKVFVWAAPPQWPHPGSWAAAFLHFSKPAAGTKKMPECG